MAPLGTVRPLSALQLQGLWFYESTPEEVQATLRWIGIPYSEAARCSVVLVRLDGDEVAEVWGVIEGDQAICLYTLETGAIRLEWA